MVNIANGHYEPDIGRARELIGWCPRRSLRSCLPAVVERLKADPFAWYEENGLNAARVAHDKVEISDSKEVSSDPVKAREHMREHEKSMTRMHFDMLWVHFGAMLLGLWLAASPFAFGTFGEYQFSEAQRTRWQAPLLTCHSDKPLRSASRTRWAQTAATNPLR